MRPGGDTHAVPHEPLENPRVPAVPHHNRATINKASFAEGSSLSQFLLRGNPCPRAYRARRQLQRGKKGPTGIGNPREHCSLAQSSLSL